MKRIITTLVVIVMLIGMFTVSAFADGDLVLVESYPEDGQKSTSLENLGVKLTFSNPVNAEANQAANNKCFSITDAEGTELPIKVYYNPDIPEQVLVLYDTGVTEGGKSRVQGSMDYTLTIKGEFVDNDGNALGEGKTITFRTLNQALMMRIYMIIMLAMMVGMVFFGMRQANKGIDKEEADDLAAQKEENFNPYKEAKRTGKSVEEVIAQHEKEVAKREARAAKLAARMPQEEDEEYDEPEDNGNYKVGRPRTVASAGSTYITGRKAEAEARAAEEERLAKRRAAAKKKKK